MESRRSGKKWLEEGREWTKKTMERGLCIEEKGERIKKELPESLFFDPLSFLKGSFNLKLILSH